MSQTPFTQIRTNFLTDKNLPESAFRLRGTRGTVQVFERQSVQDFDLIRFTGTVPLLRGLV